MGPEEGTNELESILSQSSGQSQTPNAPTYLEGPGQEELLSRTSPTQPQGTQNDRQLLAGKFKSQEDLVKGYQSANSALGKAQSRSKQLEKLLEVPGVYERLASTPEGRQTLAALGYELRTADQEEEQGQEAGFGEYDEQLISELTNVLGHQPTERDLLRYETVQLKETNRLNWELFHFGQNRGKPLSAPEERAIREVLRVAPRLSIQQAWRLTPGFEEALKAKQDEAVAAAGRKSGVKRPPPNPTLAPGQKLDMKKPVTQMNDAERRAFLTDLAEKNQ